VAEQEFRCRVNREAEEELLEVDGRAIPWDRLEQPFDMAFKGPDVRNLVSCEVGADHVP